MEQSVDKPQKVEALEMLKVWLTQLKPNMPSPTDPRTCARPLTLTLKEIIFSCQIHNNFINLTFVRKYLHFWGKQVFP